MKKFLPDGRFPGRLVRRLAVLLTICMTGLGIARAQQAQPTIAVDFRNATVQQVFTWLDNHSQYDFVYNNGQIAKWPETIQKQKAGILYRNKIPALNILPKSSAGCKPAENI